MTYIPKPSIEEVVCAIIKRTTGNRHEMVEHNFPKYKSMFEYHGAWIDVKLRRFQEFCQACGFLPTDMFGLLLAIKVQSDQEVAVGGAIKRDREIAFIEGQLKLALDDYYREREEQKKRRR